MKKDEILSAFQEVIEGPRNVYLDEWVKAGGKVMGYYCSYIPEEIFTAAGFLPYRIRGAGRTVHNMPGRGDRFFYAGTSDKLA